MDHIVLQGFRFFGCTFEFLDCQSCLVEDCELLFPTFARTLSDPSMPETWASATRMTGDNNAIRRCHLAWACGSGFAVSGRGNTIEDNKVHDVCWNGTLRHSAISLHAPDEREEPSGNAARRNTVFNFGNVGISFQGHGTLIELNHVYNGGLACKDVSLIYTQLPGCSDSVVRYNWVHGCRTEEGGGLGIRGDDQTRGLIVHHNVVWDCGRDGIIVKGDFNKVYNNTVFGIGKDGQGGNAINLHTAAEPAKPWRWQAPLLERQNAHSEIFNNAAPAIVCDNRGKAFPESPNAANNYVGEDFQLAAAANLDFRPLPRSPLVDAGRAIPGYTDGFRGAAPDIGAYESGGENWKPGITWE
ncbi:MAG: hypothetical protein BWZ10_02869 [candidate division BRC1 bacterium ADurb.BinA364]|nr:MAG: hypothetical protein BWZ10_02869 [candidate division BRC1 bacterium ADurb.BinA364]